MNIEVGYNHSNQPIKANDIFLISGSYYMLVGSGTGYALCSLSNDTYFELSQCDSKYPSFSNVVSMIKEIMEDYPVTHYSQELFKYDLKITTK